MASKIHTNNPKHHKYVTTNKKERKKNKINIVFNHINKIYYTIYEVIDNWQNRHFRTTCSNSQPLYHGVKGCKIIYDDCNHKTYRVIKNNKFIEDNRKKFYYEYYRVIKFDKYMHFKMK